MPIRSSKTQTRKERPDLAKLGAKWQARLRLQDFDISYEYAGAYEMETDVGRAYIDWQHGVARIQVMEPSENTSPKQHFQNVELTLLHELLHVMFRPFEDNMEGALANRTSEQIIEKVAKGLLGV